MRPAGTVPSVLLVEDDRAIGSALLMVLRAAGYDVTWRTDGRSAIATASAQPCDVVLLDLGLPDLDGLDVCRAVRSRRPDAVILVVTARDDELDIVVGLEAGADDYLVKPVRASELLARMRAQLRRVRPVAEEALVAGALRVDRAARRAWVGGCELALRSKEFDLLVRLAARPGTAVTREGLMADVWDANWFGPTKTLDVHVAALRRLLTEAASAAGVRAPVITTLRGFGYRLEAADDGEDGARGDPDRR